MSTTPSPMLKKFLDSMVMNFDKWHDGEGYDLETLRQLTGEDRAHAERVLIARNGADWRDVEALAALNTPKSLDEVSRSLKSPDRGIRLKAAQTLHEAGKLDDLTPVILDALKTCRHDRGLLTQTLDFIAWHQPTKPAVAAAVLEMLPSAPGDDAVSLAGLLLFLHGLRKERFDWNDRPFLLRFNTTDKKDRDAAHNELLAQITSATKGRAKGRSTTTKPAKRAAGKK